MINFKALYNLVRRRHDSKETKIQEMMVTLSTINSMTPQAQHLVAKILVEAGYRKVLL